MALRKRIQSTLVKFRSKWMLALLGVSLLPLIVSLVLVLNITNEHFRNQKVENMLAEFNRAEINLENRLSQIWLVGENLTSYLTMQLSHGRNTEQNYSELLQYESLRSNISATEAVYDITRIRIFSDRLPYVQTGDYSKLFTLDQLDPLTASHPELLEDTPVNALKSFMLHSETVPSRTTSYPFDLIVFYWHIYDANRNLIAVCLMEFDATQFFIHAGAVIPDATMNIQYESDGTVIGQYYEPGSSLPDVMPNSNSQYVIRDNQMLISKKLTNADWIVFVSMPLGSAWNVGGTISEVYLLIIVLTFLASLVVGGLFSHLLTRRLTTFYTAVKEIDYSKQTNLQVLPEKMEELLASGGQDELSQIMVSFSTLIRDNLQLINRMRLRDIDIVKYKFQVLQEQINPHFLYNALETLRLCMVADRQNDALCTLDLLTRFYRIALSKGQDTITIQTELQMVECYLEIENVGYEGRLKWTINIDELLHDLPIPKFLLQPLIENSIVHGKVAEGESFLSIWIDIGMDEDEIVMRVTDNGIGIDADTLKKLNDTVSEESALDRSFGYGLRNVSRRIKLFYGDQYGLTIERNNGRTVNTIRIPIDML